MLEEMKKQKKFLDVYKRNKERKKEEEFTTKSVTIKAFEVKKERKKERKKKLIK